MELQQLVRDCKKGRASAQKALYERFAQPLFLLCRRYVRNDEAAEEVLHNGWLKCFEAIARFDYVNDAATVGWLKRIMVNECLMHLRRNNSFLQVALEDAPELPDNERVLEGLEATEIFQLITKLPTGYRTVFNLFVLEEYGHKEIAVMLGISEGTSKSQLSKARQLLQQLLIQSNPEYALRKTR
ncbi:MAG: sigma-70 family RNA polymerase sigma factor [Chitinophagaceae bacterium]|nr:MAG: sigma-70 family RNA polymerase sigma factor [Chitinophagaceae bacterium]